MSKQSPHPINTVDNRNLPMFTTWDDKVAGSKERALQNYHTGQSDGYVIRQKTTGAYLNTFNNIDTATSVRDSFTKRDYNYFRPNEMVPWMSKDIIRSCMMAYDKVGLVKNVIDLMADFTVQGIEISHPVPKYQRLLRKWFRKVKGKQRSERIMNMFYRAGNVIIKRVMAEIPSKELKELHSAHGEDFTSTQYSGNPTNPNNPKLDNTGPGIDILYPETPKVPNNQIPVRYNILNPLLVETIGGELAPFVGEIKYGIAIPNQVVTKVRNPAPLEQTLLDQIPQYIRDWIYTGPIAGRVMPLPMERIITMFYKRDDWQLWANPMIYSILDDLMTLEKLKLCDHAAMDGIISQVRIWKIGNLEHKIYPTAAAMNKLAGVLLNNVGGGVMDLIWGPELELQETNTQAYKFLGSDKYMPTLNAIYDGLGIPPTLTAAGSAGGFTNNYISLRTLVERLNYGRDALVEFWENEIQMVQKALKIKKAPKVTFSYMTLSDENTMLTLYMNLADRGLISDETLWEKLKEEPTIEAARIKKEAAARSGGRKPRKASPFHNPEHEDDMKKIALQGGMATPSQAGVKLDENAPGQVSMQQQMLQMKEMDVKAKKQAAKQKAKGLSGQGRPKAKKDSSKRKSKTVKPRKSVKAFAMTQIWAADAYKAISDIVTPAMLQLYNKDNMRKLTASESLSVENAKLAVLFNIAPFTTITEDVVSQIIIDQKLDVPELAMGIYQEMINQYTAMNKTSPTVEDMRNMQLSVYSLLQTDYSQGDEEDE